MTTTLSITDPRVVDLHPSAKFVFLILDHAGPCSLAELRLRTQLPDRTTRRALSHLQEAGVVESRCVPGDARSTVFAVDRG